MKYRVAIIGAGQLGSRYLQGMANCKLPLDIVVVDPSKNSLIQAHERWNEVSIDYDIHTVEFLKSHDDIDNKLIDIVIIATNSGGRADLIIELSKKLRISYWVIEKVLAQSEDELDSISENLKNYPGVWVNTPRRMMNWYQEMIALTPHRSPIICTVSGTDWGLACNAIHFLDLVGWWSGEELVSVKSNKLASQWHQAKRDGYWEIFGTLEARFSGGSKLFLNCISENTPYLVKIETIDFTWDIKELEGTATRSDGEDVSGHLEFQSEMTGKLIESILIKGQCDLTILDESIALHRGLLKTLVSHWDKTMHNKITNLPIT